MSFGVVTAKKVSYSTSMDQPYFGFWKTLSRPIIALSPMDGVTDVICRTMMARHGQPHLMMTEFTNVLGLQHATTRLLQDFEYTNIERPIVAQIYGHQPEDFYVATFMVCELGFDGVDINMGCPSKKVVHKNCGAKLITLPEVALEIIRQTRQAIEDWAHGKDLEDLDLRPKVLNAFRKTQLERGISPKKKYRQLIPYSVKTRLGYDSIVIEDWVKTLLTEKPAAISIHGRTLKQMYNGSANWVAIASAVKAAQGSGTLILGNGDVTSLEKAHTLIQETKVDGVLLGRSAIGNPWVFQDKTPSLEERFKVVMEHARLLETLRGEKSYNSIKKHLVRYFRGFSGAAHLRSQAVRTTSINELSEVIRHYQSAPKPTLPVLPVVGAALDHASRQIS
jgi:tRNA-dihydrouridine synthase B